MAAHLPGRGVALARALLGLRRHRDGPAGGGDAVVAVGGQRRGVDVDGVGLHEAVLVHQPDAVVVGRAPHAGVGGDGEAEVAGELEGRLLGEGRVAGDVEGELEAEHVAVGTAVAVEEGPDRGVGRPLPRGRLDVAVGEDEPARHRAQRVDGRLGVVDGLEAVRPVDGGGDPGLERVPGREQVAGADVLGAELRAVLEVVPDEVLGEGPVGAVGPHRGLPHVAVGVDHARHHDAAAGVDDLRAVGGGQAASHLGDPVVDDEHVGVGQHGVLVVHGEHGATGEEHRPAVGGGGHVDPLLFSDVCPYDGRCGAHHCDPEVRGMSRGSLDKST